MRGPHQVIHVFRRPRPRPRPLRLIPPPPPWHGTRGRRGRGPRRRAQLPQVHNPWFDTTVVGFSTARGEGSRLPRPSPPPHPVRFLAGSDLVRGVGGRGQELPWQRICLIRPSRNLPLGGGGSGPRRRPSPRPRRSTSKRRGIWRTYGYPFSLLGLSNQEEDALAMAEPVASAWPTVHPVAFFTGHFLPAGQQGLSPPVVQNQSGSTRAAVAPIGGSTAA